MYLFSLIGIAPRLLFLAFFSGMMLFGPDDPTKILHNASLILTVISFGRYLRITTEKMTWVVRHGTVFQVFGGFLLDVLILYCMVNIGSGAALFWLSIILAVMLRSLFIPREAVDG